MIVFLLGLLLWQTPQASTPSPPLTQVVSILNERDGEQIGLRFVLNGNIASYSATREGNDVVVRIAAAPRPELGLPVALQPIQSFSFGSDETFTLKISISDHWSHEMSRESSSLLLLLRPVRPRATPTATPGPVTQTPQPLLEVTPAPTPSPSPTQSPAATQPTTQDLYQQLFPTNGDPAGVGGNRTDLQTDENWYSNFRWLGLQLKPWVSVSYIDGKAIEGETHNVTSDAYLVIQPNLGLGFSPTFGGPRAGQWKINYTPRFRRLVDLNLPQLDSHFFDASVDQPVASFGGVYGNYHFSKGILETDEIDAGREYGIGLNRVVDTTLQRFQRNSFGLGVRFDFVADTQVDVNINSTKVKYGNSPEDQSFVSGPRAFFDYETRLLNASLRRGFGEGRFLSLLYGIHDTPQQDERAQVEGRGYSYGAALEGDIAALTTGRLMFGYRTQKDPKAGAGGQDYKDITYGAQLVRELSEESTFGLSANRNLYLSAYLDNGFYVADSLRGDLNTRIPLALYLRGSLGYQVNNYKASPQQNTASSAAVLRKDNIVLWSVGVARSITQWANLRVDYTSERRNSNLDRFDVKTHALTIQVGVGFFGKPDAPVKASW